MAVSKAKKEELIIKFGGNAKNTGSIEAQIAILTEDINILTPHFKANKKDKHSQRGFLAKIQKRKDLLKYLKAQDFNKYQALIKELGLRK
ncbi:MAG: 30S ribosomal protein S15 [Mycoplasmatales bacterium]|nr:30S ribosomal protein S15 [Mycoplasmatales bacterium]